LGSPAGRGHNFRPFRFQLQENARRSAFIPSLRTQRREASGVLLNVAGSRMRGFGRLLAAEVNGGLPLISAEELSPRSPEGPCRMRKVEATGSRRVPRRMTSRERGGQARLVGTKRGAWRFLPGRIAKASGLTSCRSQTMPCGDPGSRSGLPALRLPVGRGFPHGRPRELLPPRCPWRAV